ncbi:MAG: UDP-N-acetylglucosamine 2-epimerase [Patescibacteria group bacterium]
MESDKIDKIKICVITTSRSDYGRMKPVMEAIQRAPEFALQVVAGSHLYFDHLLWYLRHGEPVSFWKSLPWYLRARGATMREGDYGVVAREYSARLLAQDGFPVHARIPMFLEGGNPRVMTKIGGLALLGLPRIFEKLRPDLIVINGDRFEMLPVAFAAVCANIPLAHIEGGDVSGTLDESIRHAVTKLAHIHFPATEKSASRLRAMGEDPERIFPVGSPIIDTISRLDLSLDNSVYERNGFGGGRRIDFTRPYVLALQHPVTTRYEENRRDTEELIAAADALNLQKIFLAPNIDAGSDGVSGALRAHRDANPERTVFFKSLIPHDFYRVLKHAAVAVGNSSSFIRESAYFGVPAVIVGDRQQGRERGENAIEVAAERSQIIAAAESRLRHGPYPRDTIFGDGNAAEKIVEICTRFGPGSVRVQKTFHS